jgi:hypothetical protein
MKALAENANTTYSPFNGKRTLRIHLEIGHLLGYNHFHRIVYICIVEGLTHPSTTTPRALPRNCPNGASVTQKNDASEQPKRSFSI